MRLITPSIVPLQFTGTKLIETGDELMMIRLPNGSGICFTITGGMHGYSIEAFYKHMKENMNILSKIVSMNHVE